MCNTCKICNTSFEATRKSQLYCSDKCYTTKARAQAVEKSKVKFKEAEEFTDYVVCKICGLHSACLDVHITKIHNLSLSEYRIKYSVDMLRSINYHNKFVGENNPAFNHGGKFSPFSKNFLGYSELSEEEKLININKTAVKAKDSRNENNNNRLRLEYYTSRGMSIAEARIALKERQSTFSLEKCINKYGEIEGYIVFKERQDKWQATLNTKSEDELADINKRKTSHTKQRKLSGLNQKFEKILQQYNIQYETEFHIRRDDNKKKSYFYDFKVDNTVIEVNGDFWHANPLFNEPDNITKFRFSERNIKELRSAEIWAHDKNKCDLAIKRGHKYLVFWENDINNNIEEVTLKLLKELRGN